MSGDVELVLNGSQRLAIIIRGARTDERVKFFTSDDCALQVGAFSMSTGYEIPPHVHQPCVRNLDQTTEVLLIQSGRVQVDFYTGDREYLETRVLHSSDVIILFEGGHGFTMLDDVRMLEIKQGPYAGENDKIRFERPKNVT